ncbi:Unknown protein, partial [Striga hermonthica]
NPDDVGLVAESQKEVGDCEVGSGSGGLGTESQKDVGDCEVESGSGDDSEDEDYFPVDESSSDDELSVDDLASDDDGEYLEARQNLKKQKNGILEDDGECADNIKSKIAIDMDSEDSGFVDCALASENSGSVLDLDEDGNCIGRRKMVTYDPNCDHSTLEFMLGMRFISIEELKKAVRNVAIFQGRDIKFLKTSKKQLRVKCVDGCPWTLYASAVMKEGSVAIKQFNKEHKCHRNIHTRQVTSEWLAEVFLEKFRKNPNMSITQMEEAISEKYAVQPTKWKLYRGKWRALEMLRGSVVGHYASLRSYMAELLRVDRDGRFEFLLGEETTFRGFYVGFSALRKGFISGCRPILGFDGCFLKTFIGGALLCATAKDGNNQIYPVAWAVVEAENEEFWRWFLSILFTELGINDGLGYTFMSDQQK